MTRIRLITIAVIALAVLCTAPAALAGTYSWNLTQDFTATPPGANPDHDRYGASPWSYSESQSGLLPGSRSHDPTTFQRLGNFSTGIQGGLVGWTGADATAPTTIALNPGADLSNGTATFPSHQLAAIPSMSRFAAIGWTSPLSQAATVLVSGAVFNDNHGSCVGGASWSLEQNGTTIASGPVSGQPFLATPMVQPGASIYLIIDPGTSLLYSQACVSSEVVLQVLASQSTRPAVSLTTPAQGAVISGGQPVFSGSASNEFGAASNVTVRVYKGSAATGTPIQTLTAARSGTSFSVTPAPPLADGTYTARAEQDDLASPPNVGLSAPVTFSVRNQGPSIVLNSPGGGPLGTSTPTLTGSGGTAVGDAHTVSVDIYVGSQPLGAPVRTLYAPVGQNGHFAATVTPPLGDGTYTALAGQRNSLGTLGQSVARTFRIKTHAPAVTLDRPAENSQVVGAAPTFSGSAGTAFGDSRTVLVTVYAGGNTQGRVAARLHTTANGSFWSVQAPFALPPGRYTALASQTDDAGHTGRSVPSTFSIVAAPGIVGTSVGLDGSDTASIAITCRQVATENCSGTVLVLSAGNFRGFPGGPVGQLRILYAYVSIPGGQTLVVKQGVPGRVASLLRSRAPLPVIVTASLRDLAGQSIDVTARRTLRLT